MDEKSKIEKPGVSPGAEGGGDKITPLVWMALSDVNDPELHYNIVDLGLVYGVETADGLVKIRITLTSPACPYGPYILHEARQAAKSVPGVKDAELDLTFDPPWEPALMSEEARLELGFDI